MSEHHIPEQYPDRVFDTVNAHLNAEGKDQSRTTAFIDARRKGHGHQVANPDDPVVQRPPQGQHGPLPEPYFLGLPGRAAIVQGQVLVVAFIVVAQLGIVTDTLYESLSGRTDKLVGLALVSAVGFVIAIVVWRWPRKRIVE